MARIILLLGAVIIAILALPMYFLLSLWILVIDEILKTHHKKKEKKEMSKRDEILRVIEKELKEADNDDIAEAYAEIIGCGKCPYWHDCQNMLECSTYIFDKLRAEDGRS